MQPAAPLIVFCQPGDRRSAGIQQARSRLGMPPALLIPYAGLLEGQPLADLLTLAVQRQIRDGGPGQPLLEQWESLRDYSSGPSERESASGSSSGHPTQESAGGSFSESSEAEAQRLLPDSPGGSFSRHAAPESAACPPLLRLESPGGSFALERALIALGAPDAPDADDSLHPFGQQPDLRPLSFQAASALKDLPGVLHHPSQWFRGYCRLLARLRQEAGQLLPASRWTNDPAEIAAMTDKRRTQQILAESGVSVPRPLRGSGGQVPVDYASLRELMLSQRMHRVFIKLASGSAASGVIAYQLNPATGAESAVTTIGVESYITRPPVYYNSGKLQRYTDSARLAGIINWLYRHGAYAEQWIPKPGKDGHSFDIRQLVVAGEACHAVARVSTTPITNLHLRSRRMTPAEAGLSEAQQAEVRRTAEASLAAFPNCSVAGIDVLAGSSGRMYTADVNPFGDLLYDVEYQGCSTYEWEMKQLS
ncbi:STM4014 family protein [Paenibacillus silagei]|uniref:Glutathione synthase/RimK-type ligase-like ATP-grasp enzyme n=1 Tax=Paenibacillus silagei TaxID=1670801 RepID=A0ABS4P1N5_9BACL|nr:STM4014 family protein [Paenibacillus silagei]MBP2115656.1 glutathione synthase/RimK-type ligase-like ATP-grasp enzyme [Paenibacillus silagei]